MRLGLMGWRHRFASALAFLLVACGGGGSGGGAAPSISNLSVSPTAIYLYSPSDTVSITSQFDFYDPDGNVTAANLKIRDSSGTTVDVGTTPIDGLAGETSGSIVYRLQATQVAPDTYTFLYQVTDATSLWSNVLSAAVRIANFPWVSRAVDPYPREYAASAELDGKFYVVGGQLTTNGTVTNIVTVYDPATNSWSLAAPMPTARMGLTLTAYGGKLYAIGGRTDGFSTSSVSTIEIFDPVTGWTTPVQPPNFTARYNAAAALANTSFGDLIVVAGGEREAFVLNEVQGYNPLTNAWFNLAPLTTARGQLAMSAVNGRLYAVGGYAGVAQQWVGTVEEYNPTTGLWTTKSPMPTARAFVAMAVINGQLLAAGGESQPVLAPKLSTLESYDPVANVWTTKTASSTAFTRATAGVVNNRLYVLGNGLTLQYDPANELY